MKMKRVAFVFPGQGVQEVGMGRDLIDRDPFTEELLARASEGTGYDMKSVCQRGPDKTLRQTDVLQPALTAVCLGLWHRLIEAGVRPHAAAGHSLGEIPALAASGFADPLALIDVAASRGRLMGEAAKENSGGMLAINGLSLARIDEEVDTLKTEGVLAIAAVNAPTQVTVSGDTALLRSLKAALSSEAQAKITSLRVSGAWHSSHMARAVPPFEKTLRNTAFRQPEIAMVFNRHGEVERDPRVLPDLIGHQLVRPVRWDLAMAQFGSLGITHIVEIGPGRTLRGLCRLNPATREMTVVGVSSLRSLERALDEL